MRRKGVRQAQLRGQGRAYLFRPERMPVSNGELRYDRIVTAFEAGNGAVGQLWLFIVAPLIGGALGALVYLGLFGRYKGVN